MDKLSQRTTRSAETPPRGRCARWSQEFFGNEVVGQPFEFLSPLSEQGNRLRQGDRPGCTIKSRPMAERSRLFFCGILPTRMHGGEVGGSRTIIVPAVMRPWLCVGATVPIADSS